MHGRVSKETDAGISERTRGRSYERVPGEFFKGNHGAIWEGIQERFARRLLEKKNVEESPVELLCKSLKHFVKKYLEKFPIFRKNPRRNF